jgi:hypothetical protein
MRRYPISEIEHLKAQVESLKEVISVMEKQQEQMNNKNSDKNLDKLVTRWRDKVYECLVTNKRYEVIIRENIKKFKIERESMNKELQS